MAEIEEELKSLLMKVKVGAILYILITQVESILLFYLTYQSVLAASFPITPDNVGLLRVTHDPSRDSS